MNKGGNKIFDVIRSNHEFLSWLNSEESPDIKEMPDEYKADCKQLQNLGIVYKRNNRSLGIKWQRLRQLISRHDKNAPFAQDALLNYFAEPSARTAS